MHLAPQTLDVPELGAIQRGPHPFRGEGEGIGEGLWGGSKQEVK